MNSNAKWFALGAVTCAGCFMLGGMGKQPVVQDTIIAKRIFLVDENEKPRVSIGSENGTSFLSLHDPDGIVRFMADASQEYSSMGFLDPLGNSRVSIAAHASISSWRLEVPGGSIVASIGNPMGEAVSDISLRDATDTKRWVVENTPGRVTQWFRDAKGDARVFINADAKSEQCHTIPAREPMPPTPPPAP